MSTPFVVQASAATAFDGASEPSIHLSHHGDRNVRTVSAAQPLALALVTASLVFLLQALIRSFVRHSIALPADARSTHPDAVHKNASDVLDLSQCETPEEVRLAEAALGRIPTAAAAGAEEQQEQTSTSAAPIAATSRDDSLARYHSQSRTRIGLLAFIAAAQLAIAAGMLAWILSANAGHAHKPHRQRTEWKAQVAEAAIKALGYVSWHTCLHKCEGS